MKPDSDLRYSGIVLIQNGMKAFSIANDNVEAFLANTSVLAEKNWGCYMLQQTFELIIKGLLNYYGEYFREGHFILDNAKRLIDIAEKHKQFELASIMSSIDKRFASILYKWEHLGRYKNLWVKYSDVQHILSVAESLVICVKRNIEQLN